MINTQTLFILGAGASWPYGFPTGQGLREYIIYKFPEYYRQILTPYYNRSRSSMDEAMVEVDHFIKAFKGAPRTTIDDFLSINPAYQNIGKKAIATSILYYEKESKFGEDINNHQQEDWFSLLFNKMIEGFTSSNSLDDFAKNKISFITFNYDRSLEHFFYTALLSYFDSRKDDIILDTKKYIPFTISHVYGQIDKSEWDKEAKTSFYRPSIDYQWINVLKDNIKVIGEREEKDDVEISKLLSNAEIIFFLGFGYATENIEALNFLKNIRDETQIYGTGKDFTKEEIEEIRSSLLRKIGNSIVKPTIEDNNCHGFLKKYLRRVI